MVNVGGPSKGCITCIRRKIRCDRQQPACGHCQKAKRECGGYRDTNDTMFRDQSIEVVSKFQGGSRNQSSRFGKTSRPDISASPGNSPATSSSASNTTPLPRSPALDQENGWIDFFANNFACSGTVDSKTNLFWIPPNFGDLLKNNSAKFGVQSVGAIALARLQRSPYFLEQAQKNYSLALLRLAEVWRQEITNADKDTIFFVVLLLSFFEVLATYDSSARKSWITHLGGLGVLFKNNEEYYSTTEFGSRMFFHARSQVILVALQTKTSVAEAFSRPNPGVRRSAPPQFKAFDDVDTLLIRLAELQATCRIAGPSSLVLEQLATLESDCSQWGASLPSSWAYSTHEIGRPDAQWWDTSYHEYTSPVIEHTWNKVRAARIRIHDLIQVMRTRLNPEQTHLDSIQGNEKVLDPMVQQLVIEICSTVPLRFRPSIVTAETSNNGNAPRLGTTYWLLWVLDVVGSMCKAPPELTSWVIQCFEYIHDLAGNVRAHIVANKLKMGQRTFSASLSYPDLMNMKK